MAREFAAENGGAVEEGARSLPATGAPGEERETDGLPATGAPGDGRRTAPGADEACEGDAPSARPVVVYLSFPFELTTPAFGTHQPFVADSAARAAYLDAIGAELESLDQQTRTRPVLAVRLGGGVSYARADGVCALVRRIRKTLNMARGAEVSLVADPLTVGTPTLTDWTGCGVNRVLLTARSVHDAELRALGVPHTRQDVDNALAFLTRFRMRRVDLRLTYGLPGQTPDSWEKTLLTAADMGVAHVTALPLAGLAGMTGSDGVTGPYGTAGAGGAVGTEVLARMEAVAVRALGAHGYTEYAPGSFVLQSADGARDRFAREVGAGTDLLGLGAGARSAMDGYLYANQPDFDAYVRDSADFTLVARDVRREGEDARQARVTVGLLDSMRPVTADDLARACGLADASRLDGRLADWLDGLVRKGDLARVGADPGQAGRALALTARGKAARLSELGAAEVL